MLIGNLTRDPELRYTPNGVAVCSFGLATNRAWTTEAGEKKEDAEFHRIVAWNKLAELCSQLLTKGRKVFVEGRLQTRSWQAQDGQQRSSTEIVIEDMIILDSRKFTTEAGSETSQVTGTTPARTFSQVAAVSLKQSVAEPKVTPESPAESKIATTPPKVASADSAGAPKEDINIDDIPF